MLLFIIMQFILYHQAPLFSIENRQNLIFININKHSKKTNEENKKIIGLFAMSIFAAGAIKKIVLDYVSSFISNIIRIM